MPLANLLSPLVARKALELKQQLDPPQTPIAAGYLQQQGLSPVGADVGQVTMPTEAERARVDAGYRKRLADARAKEKSPSQSYDPRDQTPEMNAGIEAFRMSQHGTMLGRAVGKRMLGYLNGKEIMPMPNANAAAPQGEPAAVDELGRPVYDAPATKPSRIIQVKPGEVTDETGQAIGPRGKKLGYLDQETDGMRYLDRRPGDLNLDQTAGNIIRDPFARKQLTYQYGEHLKAMEGNRDADGRPTDQLPDGYFQALGEQRGKPFSKDERSNILKGMKKLKEVQKAEAQYGDYGPPVATI